jgi:flagellar biosynthetic protein FliR
MEEELLTNIYYISLILGRMVGLFLLAPIFSSQAVPRRIRVSIMVVLTLFLLPFVPTDHLSRPGFWLFAGQLLVEIGIGLTIGFILLVMLSVIQLAGEFIDRRMGFFMASIMSPQFGSNVPLLGQFKNIIAMLVFLAVEGHHKILDFLMRSFELVRLAQFEPSSELFASLIRIIGDLFPLAAQVALPVLGTLFIVDVSFGLVARTVPQLNIFIVGLPAKILVGLIILIITLPNYIQMLKGLFEDHFNKLYNIIELMG